MSKTSVGNPRCPDCHGKGGTMHGGQWVRCACVRGTRSARDWNSYFNSIGAKNPAPKPPTR